MESIHESWKPIFEKHNDIIKKIEEIYNTWGFGVFCKLPQPSVSPAAPH